MKTIKKIAIAVAAVFACCAVQAHNAEWVCADDFAQLEKYAGHKLLDQDFDGGPFEFEQDDKLPQEYGGIAWFDATEKVWCSVDIADKKELTKKQRVILLLVIIAFMWMAIAAVLWAITPTWARKTKPKTDKP